MISFKIVQKFRWLLSGIASLLLRQLSAHFPSETEQIYSRGLYRIIRWLFDKCLSFMPFPLLYLFVFMVFWWFFRWIKHFFNKKITLKTRYTEGGVLLLNFLGLLLFLFNILWGFNYDRMPLHKQLGFEVQNIDLQTLKNELELSAKEAIALREQLPLQNDAVSESEIRKDVAAVLQSWGQPVAVGNIRVRQIKPDGLMFGLGISGIYMPFVGESNIDAALHPLEKPFVIAHELAHGYGWTDEATANFVAYMACIRSQNPYTRYAGYVGYYRYVAGNYKRADTEGYQKFRATLPAAFVADLDAINVRLLQYKTWFETQKINDTYLKSQGVKEGVQSYSRVVLMVANWRKKSLN